MLSKHWYTALRSLRFCSQGFRVYWLAVRGDSSRCAKPRVLTHCALHSDGAAAFHIARVLSVLTRLWWSRIPRVAGCLWASVALACLLGLPPIAEADTIEHSGPVLEDTVWLASDEHLVTGDVTIYPQVTLTVEAGATVRFAAASDDQAGGNDSARAELIVNGSLLADGTEAEPVTFTSDAATPAPSYWGGIRHDSRYPFVLRHAVIEYGSVGVDYRVSGAVSASVTIEDSVIRHSGGNGVSLSGSNGATLTALVRGNELHDHSGSGLTLSNGSGSTLAATVTGNLVYATTGVTLSNSGVLADTRINGNEIRDNLGNGLYVYAYGGAPTTLHLEDNNVHDNSGDGLYLVNPWYEFTAVIRGNAFVGNSRDGIDFYDGYSGRIHPQVSLNRIEGNGDYGIRARYTRGAGIVHNRISGNGDGGIYLEGQITTARINFNDLSGDNGSYDIRNADSRAVDARANWWGAVTTAEMDAGGNPKDIVRIEDIFDNNSYGAVDYGQWLGAAPALAEDPLSWVKSPADGAVLKAETVRIEGAASAATDIDRVEVSTDGGSTWVVAEGTLSWSYQWTVPGDGSYLLRSRVVTTDGATETPASGNRITIDSTLPTTSGSLAGDEAWQDDVTLTGDVTVPAGVTLSIDAGTTIGFQAGADDQSGGNDSSRAELIVEGTLIIDGTETDPVVLTTTAPTPTAGLWGGVRVINGDLIIRHAVIEYGSVGVDYRVSGAVSASVTIEDSVIRHSGGNGVSLSGSNGATLTALVRGNELHDHSGSGLTLSNGSGSTLAATVTGNLVYATTGVTLSNSGVLADTRINGNEIRDNLGNGLYVYAYGGAPTTLHLEDNNVHDNSGDGLYLVNPWYEFTAVIRGNAFVGNSRDGIDFYDGYSGRIHPQVSLNRIEGNGDYGIRARYTRGAGIVHNRISGNGDGGIYLEGQITTARINFNDLSGDNGSYDIRNADSRAVDARANWWGAVTTAEMDAGGNPKDIVRIEDIFDNNSYGAVDYGQWLGAAPALAEDPLSWVKSPADGAVLKAETVRIEGAASAATDIDRVEVSTDGGSTWVVAEGTLSWSYQWTVPGDGSYLLRSRVVTTDDVLETPGAGNLVTIDNAQPGTPGTLVEDETWTGDLLLTGDITVPAGVTLTITPGSLITFAPNRDDLLGGSDASRAELIVEGALIIQGTEESPVEITSNAPFPLEGDWGGIKITSGVLDMQHAIVEYAEDGIICEADGVPVECIVTDSTIRSNSGYGIYGHALGAGVLDLWIENNTVSGNLKGGAYLHSQGGSADPLLTGLIVGNDVVSNTNYGLYVYTYNGAEAAIELDRNLIEGNGEGVYVYNHSASAASLYRLFGNEISNNGTGLRYYNYYAGIEPEIANNFVHDNLSHGLHLTAGTNATLAPTLTGNTIIDNGQGIYANATGVLTAAQNQLYGNGIDIYNDAAVDIDARQNWWGTSTTNILSTGSHPRNLSNLFDGYDDGSKGFIDYADWLTLFERPAAPTVDPVQTPVSAETQTLAGTKEAGTGIGVNGSLVVPADAETTWTATIDLREGNNPLSVYAIDPMGILSDLVSVTIVRDTEPPRILSSIPANDDTVTTQIRDVEIVLYDDATTIDFDHVTAQASILNSEGNAIPGSWTVRNGHLLFTASTFLAPDTYVVNLSLRDTPLGNAATASFGFTVDVTDITPPLPVAVTVDAAGDGFSAVVDWSDYDEAGQGDVASFSVYIDDALFTQVGAMTPVVTLPAGTSTYTADGLIKGQQYYFAVVAKDVRGNANTSVTPETAVPTDIEPPEDVTGLRAESGATSLLLRWNHSADSAGDLAAYRVYVGDGDPGTEVTAGSNSHDLMGLSEATAYAVRVTAVDQDGNESIGPTLTAATLLPNPTGLAATPQVEAVDLAWTAVEPANLVQQYAVYVAASDFADVTGLTPAKLVGSGTISTRIDGLTSGIPYYFAATAINLSGGERKAVSTVSAVPMSDLVTISGQVTDSGGQPVPGIEICMSGPSALDCSAQTDAAGRYVLNAGGDSLSAGDYLVEPRATAATGPHTFAPVNAQVQLGAVAVPGIDFTATFIPDTIAPDTTITTGPGEGATITSDTLDFAWSGSDDRSGTLTFAYRLDGQPWSAFDAATAITLTGLTDGAHRFEVKARDAAGNEDATPAERNFLIDATPPEPASAFTAAVTEAGIRLDWSGSPSPDVARYRLYWNGGAGDIDYTQPLATIIHPTNAYVVSGLPGEGTYRFGLRAGDTAGNRELNTDVTATADIVGLSISVDVPDDTYDRGQDVPVAGSVLSPLGEPVADARVVIAVRSNGAQRTFTAYTNAQGGFNYVFQPLAGEAGSYTVAATVESNGLEQTASDSFRVLGLWLQPSSVSFSLSMNAQRTVDVTLRNIGDVTLTGLHYAVEDLDPTDPLTGAMDAAALPDRLEPGEQATVPVTLSSAAGDAPAIAAALQVRIDAAEGSAETTLLNVQLADAVARPVIEPQPLKLGVQPAAEITRTLTVRNAGYAPIAAAQLTLHEPDAYPWVQVLSGDLDTLVPQQAKEVQVRIAPSADMALGTHVIQLDLSYDGELVTGFIEVEITATDLAIVAVRVHDDTGAVVPTAEVNLISEVFYVNTTPDGGEQEYNNVIQGKTDANGELTLEDVPAGDYRYLIQASGHDPLEGEIRVEPGTEPQPLSAILVTNLVTVDFNVTPTTIADQYEVTLEITYATNLTKPTLFSQPSKVDLSFFPEETQAGLITVTNTSNHAPVRDLVMSSAALDPDDNELEVRFSNGEKQIDLPALGPGETVQVPYTASISNAATARLNSRQLGNITVSGRYTYSLDGQALEGTTTTPIPVIYYRPSDLRLPAITFVNDEEDGDLTDLEYQGDTYRLEVVSNRDVVFNFDPTLKAVSHINDVPDNTSIIDQNAALWTETFNSNLPLTFKGDVASFDIDGLQQALETQMSTNRAAFLDHARSLGFRGLWADRNAPDAYLIPISIVTKRDQRIIVSGCVSCGTTWPSWSRPAVPTLMMPQGEVKIRIDQRASLEREAFGVVLDLTPNVAPLDNVVIALNVVDNAGADAGDLFYEIVTQQSGLASLTGGNATGPVNLGWQLVPSRTAGGLDSAGQTYEVYASISYEYQGNAYSYDTPAETITVLPMPKLTVHYEAPYVVMAGKPAKIRVRVTNNGAGPANQLTISSLQPQIVDNPNGVPVNFAITGFSPSADPAGFQPGETTITFDSIEPGATVEGYWGLTTTRNGYFVDFTANLEHLGYRGVEIDPLIDAVSTDLLPAIGGTVNLIGCTLASVQAELWQGGVLVASDPVNENGVYYIPDLAAGEYLWQVKDTQGYVLAFTDITVLAEQPTAHINSAARVDPDSDDDGLDDCWELEHFGRLDHVDGDPEDDPDGDGATNAEESLYRTDSYNWDTDGDGISDKEEIDAGSNPLVSELKRTAPSLGGAGGFSAPNAVVVTHGWRDDADGWVRDLAYEICVSTNYISMEYDLKPNRFHRFCSGADWDVWVVDWRDSAVAPLLADWWTLATLVYANASIWGEQFGYHLTRLAQPYEKLHLIAHSAGSNLIDIAAGVVKAHHPTTVIHETFLDPYNPWWVAGSRYGEHATWSDSYVDRGLVWTDSCLSDAYTVDITELFDPLDVDKGAIAAGHGWPIRYYLRTMDGELPYGYEWAEASGSDNSPATNASALPKGRRLLLDWNGAEITWTETEGCSNRVSRRQQKNCTGALSYWNARNVFFSDADYASVDLDGGCGASELLLQSGSPHWARVEVETTSHVNRLQFHYEFETAAEGVLRVFVNGTLVHELDQGVLGAGRFATRDIFVGELQPGIHAITFRIDAYSDAQARVRISDLDFGLASFVDVDPQDLDGDGDIDQDDLDVIQAALGEEALSSQDPRDVDRDGRITPSDSDALAEFCTRDHCATEAGINQPPIAHAGIDRALRLGVQSSLDGASSTDPDNGPAGLDYSWSQQAGPSVTLVGRETAKPSFTPFVAGTYIFNLEVFDGRAWSQTDAVTITVPRLGDVDADGDIDSSDFSVFRATLGKCDGDAGYEHLADYDDDGCISYSDYRLWLGYYRAR